MKSCSTFVLLAFWVLFTGCGREEKSVPPVVDEKRTEQSSSTISSNPTSVGASMPSDQPEKPARIPDEAPSEVARNRAKGDVFAALSAMHKLMREWNPIGLPNGDLLAKLGPPTSVSEGRLVYRFDHGKGGWEWVFVVVNGKVAAVEKSGLD